MKTKILSIIFVAVLFISVSQNASAAPFDKSYALLIGINKAENWPPLEFPSKDIENMEKKLKKLGFAEIISLANEKATKGNIFKTLNEELNGKLKFDDQLLIFFSGHTYTETTMLKPKMDYLIPFEAKKTEFISEVISLAELKKNVLRLQAKHILLIVDGCISDSEITIRYGLPFYTNREELEKTFNQKVFQIISACNNQEKIEEAGVISLFLKILSNALDGEADKNSNNLLTGSELGSYMRNKLSFESNQRQNSLYGKIAGTGEFIFSLKEKTLSAPTTEEMVLVPAGEFTMGSPQGEGSYEETPQHKVYLDSFYIGKFEVTNALYQNFMKAINHRSPAYWKEARLNQPNQPVIGVDWDDALAYCTWAGKRLPTEAEWEKAARSSGGSKYPWGNESDAARANFGKTTSSPTLVGKYASGKTIYGSYDMAGNVWEWVNDWYDDDYYRRGNNNNPIGPKNGTKKILRGGSWFSSAHQARSAMRFWVDSSYRYLDAGFRCAE